MIDYLKQIGCTKFSQNDIVDFLRTKDYHIQLFINSWKDRTYVYRIHSLNHYIPNSNEFLLDDDKVVGNYDFVQLKAIKRVISLIKMENDMF